MSSLTRPRQPAAILFAGLLASMLLAACTGAGPTTSPPASQAPVSPSAPAPSDPGAAVDVDSLLRGAATKDGQTVRVTGNFLADETSAQLCEVLLESYPPQCGGGVRLTGTVPADTLARLTTTTEPGLKKMWWGFVTVTGTFHAVGANGQPSIDLGEVTLVEG